MFDKKFMKFYTLKIAYVIIGLFYLAACSSDEPNFKEVIEGREGDCFDGILNGDEVIVDCGGDCPGFCPVSTTGILVGEPRGDFGQLEPAIEYRLTGPFLIRDGYTLSIPAGTIIKADPGVGAYIAVAQGGTLRVSGQPENPVVITSGAENPAPGDWGGIIICGQGPISGQETGRTDIIDIFYGGMDIENSSGGINYLRVEYAGAVGETGQNFDAISLYGVGAFTNITNVQTFESLGNGIRLIGGNANATNLIATNSAHNGIVLQDDWSGNGDSWYLSGISNAGLKITTDEDTEFAQPSVTDTITNISIIGPAPEGGFLYTAGGGKYDFFNTYTSSMTLGINVDGTAAAEQIGIGNLRIDSIEFDNPAMGFIPTNYPGDTIFYMENTTLGAGNRASVPDWAIGWTIGIE